MSFHTHWMVLLLLVVVIAHDQPCVVMAFVTTTKHRHHHQYPQQPLPQQQPQRCNKPDSIALHAFGLYHPSQAHNDYHYYYARFIGDRQGNNNNKRNYSNKSKHKNSGSSSILKHLITYEQMMKFGLLDTMNMLDYSTATTASSSSSRMTKAHHMNLRVLQQLTQTAHDFIRTISQMTHHFATMALEAARKNMMILTLPHQYSLTKMEEEKTIQRMVLLLHSMMTQYNHNNGDGDVIIGSTIMSVTSNDRTTYTSSSRRSNNNNNNNNNHNRSPYQQNNTNHDHHNDDDDNVVIVVDAAKLPPQQEQVKETPSSLRSRRQEVNTVTTKNPKLNQVIIPVTSSTTTPTTKKKNQQTDDDENDYDNWNDNEDEYMVKTKKGGQRKKNGDIDNNKKTTGTGGRKKTTTALQERAKVAKEVLQLAEQQAKKNVEIKYEKRKMSRAANNQNQADDDGSLYIEEKMEQQRILNEAKKRLKRTTAATTIQKTTDTKKSPNKTSPAKKAAATAVKGSGTKTTTKVPKMITTKIMTEEQNERAEQHRIRLAQQKTTMPNNPIVLDIKEQEEKVGTIDNDNDATMQLEYLAQAARRAVEEFEKKQLQQQQQQQDADRKNIMIIKEKEKPVNVVADTKTSLSGTSFSSTNNGSSGANTVLAGPSSATTKVSEDSGLPHFLTTEKFNMDKINDIARMAREAVEQYMSNNYNKKEPNHDLRNGVVVTANSVVTTKKDWSTYTVNELRHELRQRSLPASGTKLKLIQLLEQSDLKQQAHEYPYQKVNGMQEQSTVNDGILPSWQEDMGLSDEMMNNLEKLAQAARDAVDRYEEKQQRTVNDNNRMVLPTQSKVLTQKKDHTPPAATMAPLPDYAMMTVPVLKAELKSRGLPISGLKVELIQRLVQHDNVANQVSSLDRAGATPAVIERNVVVEPVKNNNKQNSIMLEDDDDDGMRVTLNDDDKDALAVIDELLFDLDDLGEPTDDALLAIENEMSTIDKDTKRNGFSLLMNDDDMSSAASSIGYSPSSVGSVSSSTSILATSSLPQYEKMSMTQLKAELKLRQLRLVGKKIDLIQRLRAHDQLMSLRSPSSIYE